MGDYTNVPVWKMRGPRTDQALHDGIDKMMPIDTMP